jgi:acyl dehydratase
MTGVAGERASGAATAFDPQRLVALPPRETRVRHDARDVILYALGVGVGQGEASAAHTLRLAYEPDLAVLPSMAVVMAWPGFWLAEPQYGVDSRRVLHAEQSLQVHAPLPVEGEITSRLRIQRIVDKGAAKGSLLYSRRDLFDAGGALLATERRATFLRGDGGHGDAVAEGVQAVEFESLAETPTRAPDAVQALPTREDQALLYRLSGDRNPLHVDPAVAAAAGFPRPILHGLCTYGVAARALQRALCGDAAARFARMDCRFSQPMLPGDTLAVDIWRMGDGEAAFRARALERDVVVLSHGRFLFHPEP